MDSHFVSVRFKRESSSPPRPGKWIFSPSSCSVFCLGLGVLPAREAEVHGTVATYLKIDLSLTRV